MLKQGIYLSLLNFGGRSLNFLLYWLIANKFGVTASTDWFFFIYAIVFFINTILIKSVENVFVPLLCGKESTTAHELFLFTNRIALWGTVIISLACLFFGFIIAPKIFTIHVPISWQLAVLICALLALQPALSLLSSFFSSYLQSTQKYILPTISLSLRTIGILPILLIPGCETILCLTIAFLAGEFCRLFILSKQALPEVLHTKKQINHIKPIPYKSVFRHVGWVSIALALSQINPAVDLAMVGNLGEGSVTVVDYATKFRGVPILLLGGFLTMLLGEWSHKHNTEGLGLTFSDILKVVVPVIFITTIVTLTLLYSIDQWLPLVFFSHNFSVTDIDNIKTLLIAYFPGIPFLAGYFVCNKALLVYQKTKFIVFLALMNVTLNIIFNSILIKIKGLAGVAISTSCLNILSLITALLLLKFLLNNNAPPKGAS